MINTNNKRTRKTIRNALGMTLGCLDEHKPRQLGTRFIDTYFSRGNNPTGKWLRSQLLVERSSWDWERGQCKTYTYNPQGVQRVKQLLDIPEVVDTKQCNKELAMEWLQTALPLDEVEYEDKSNRLWTPLQFVPKTTRNEHLIREGLTVQYDIRSAAPTLLHQYSWNYSYGHVLETIDDYIENRTERRSQLAKDSGLEVDNIKKIINMLFAGGVLTSNPRSACWDLCNQDSAVVDYLKQHPYILALKDDIKQMWEYLRPELPITPVTTKTGRVINRQMSPRNKWHLYFELERDVLDAIRSYLELNRVRYLLIHDAFISEPLPHDIQVLEDFVRRYTGFQVVLESSLLEAQVSESLGD